MLPWFALSRRLRRRATVFWLFLVAAQTPVFAAVCDGVEAEAKLAVTITGFRDTEGNVRAQIYSDDPQEWLEKGKKLVRVDEPVSGDPHQLCVPLPGPGAYALAVLHDANANGKTDFFSEGFAFSRNPKLGLSKPDHEKVIFQAPAGLTSLQVNLYYIAGNSAQSKARRRRRR